MEKKKKIILLVHRFFKNPLRHIYEKQKLWTIVSILTIFFEISKKKWFPLFLRIYVPRSRLGSPHFCDSL